MVYHKQLRAVEFEHIWGFYRLFFIFILFVGELRHLYDYTAAKCCLALNFYCIGKLERIGTLTDLNLTAQLLCWSRFEAPSAFDLVQLASWWFFAPVVHRESFFDLLWAERLECGGTQTQCFVSVNAFPSRCCLIEVFKIHDDSIFLSASFVEWITLYSSLIIRIVGQSGEFFALIEGTTSVEVAEKWRHRFFSFIFLSFDRGAHVRSSVKSAR